jgi:hypothetical protein
MKRILILLLLALPAAHADSIADQIKAQQQEAQARYDAQARANATNMTTGAANGAGAATGSVGGAAVVQGAVKATQSSSYDPNAHTSYKPSTISIQCKYNPVLCGGYHRTSRATREVRPPNSKAAIGALSSR